MKNISIIITVFLFFSLQLRAQQVFQWAVNSGGTNLNIINAIACNGEDIYIAGKYAKDFKAQGKEVKSNGLDDIFLEHIKPDGKTDWVTNIGGSGNDEATCLAVKGDTLYIAGLITGEINFDKKKYVGSKKSLFVSQSSKKGKSKWICRLSYSGHATLDVLECNNDSSLLIGGMIYGTLDTGNEILKSKGKGRAYTIILSPKGEPLYATLSSGKGNHRLVSATYDIYGNKYLLFSISGLFNYSEGSSTCSSGNVSKGLFLVKSSPLGEILWYKSFECPDYSEGVKVITDKQGNPFLCANFAGSFTLGDTMLTNKGQLEIAALSFNREGHLKWVQKVDSPVKSRVLDAVVTDRQELLITGYFRNRFSTGETNQTGDENMGDLFLLQFDKSGTPAWHDKPGENAASYGNAVALDGSGNLIIAGEFANELSLKGKSLKASGSKDIFIAKYFNCAQKKVTILDGTPICEGSEKELTVSGGYQSCLWNNSILSNSLLIDSPGTYFVKATDALGCIATDTVMIPEATQKDLWLGNDTTLYEGDEITLAAQAGFYNYEWDDGYIGQARTIKYDANADSVIIGLTALDENGCISHGSITVWFKKTGIEKSATIRPDKTVFTAYPNPVNSELFWSIDAKGQAKVAVRLTTTGGITVFEKEIENYVSGSLQTIHMDGLAAGNYMLSLKTGGSNYIGKIVKK